jgi:H+-transporting ATPase
MSLTTDRASPAPSPGTGRMRNITMAAAALSACKLGFSLSVLAFGKFGLELRPGALQPWVLASSAADLAIVSALALSGTLMEPLPWGVLAALLASAAAFALMLDQVKLRVRSLFRAG